MYAVDVIAIDVFSKGNPRKIFEGNYFLPTGRRFDIHPDGDRFVIGHRGGATVTDAAADQQFWVVVDWFEELKRLTGGGNR